MRLLRHLLKHILAQGPLRWYSSLYVSSDLYTAASNSSSGWTKHLLPTRAERLAGLVDSSIAYEKHAATNFCICSRWGVNREVNLDIENDSMISQISAGRQHFAILTTNGNVLVYRSSSNDFTSLAHSQNMLTSYQRTFRQVACGLDHTLALTSNGQVFSCGWGADGQNGNGDEATLTDFAPVVGDICNKRIIKINTCADSCFAIADDGIVFAWGNNEYGQLALNTSEIQVTVPQQCQLPSLSERIVHVASGGAFTCFLTESGSVYCVGSLLETKDQQYLLHGENSDIGPVISLYAGLHYVVACCQEVVLVWGHYPATSRKLQPLKLSPPNSSKIHSVSPMLHELLLIMDA